MVGWHHRLNGHEFEQALGVGDGQGGLACCGPWGHKESDTTELLNNNFLLQRRMRFMGLESYVFLTKEKMIKTHFCCEVLKKKTPVNVRTQLCLFSHIWNQGPSLQPACSPA